MSTYKNVTENVLKFRAFNEKGDKVKLELKPGEEVELVGKPRMDGLVKVKNKKKGDK